MRKKQQTTEHENSPDHIILHHTPAALLQAEENLIHLDAGFSLLGHFFRLFVQCLGSLCTFYFIYKIVSVSILFKSMQSNIRGVNQLTNVSRRSYCLIKSLMLCIK